MAVIGPLSFLCLLLIVGFASSVCVGHSAVLIYASESNAIPYCKDVSKCENKSVAASTTCPGLACCSAENCTTDILQPGTTTCSGENISLVFQVIEGSKLLIITETHFFVGLDRVMIEGQGGVVTIECEKESAIVIDEVKIVEIRNVEFVNCGGAERAKSGSLIAGTKNGALVLNNCFQAYLKNVHFISSAGAGVVVNTSTVEQTDMQQYNYTFEHSSFSMGENETSLSGGGVSMHLFRHVKSSTALYVNSETAIYVQFLNCSFVENQALSGGGVFVLVNNEDDSGYYGSLSIYLQFQFCQFENNSAAIGGAVAVLGNNWGEYCVTFEDCNFFGNKAALYGGAVNMGMHSTQKRIYTTDISFSRCQWELNTAPESSAISVTNTNDKSGVKIVDSSALNNAAEPGNSTYNAHCTLSFGGIDKVTVENINVSNNIGSAMCLRKAELVVKGNVVFSFNHRAKSGGGILLQGGANILILRKAILSLQNNAAVYGGGIFSSKEYMIGQKCVLNSESSITCADIQFKNNIAYFNGGKMYFTFSPQSCTRELNNICDIELPDRDINSAVPNDQVQFLNTTVYVFPGQVMVLNVRMEDFWNNAGKALVRIYLHPHDGRYYLAGATEFTLQDGENHPNLTIIGPSPSEINTDYYLEIASIEAMDSNLNQYVSVVIVPCAIGFVYDEQQQKCTCAHNLTCDYTSGTACISKGHWFGSIDNSSDPASFVCSSGYCSDINQNECKYCASRADAEYCLLTEQQCIQSRTGVMCIQCPENSSYTFAALDCTSNDNCVGYGLIVAVLTTYCILSLLLLFTAVKLKGQIMLGELFCFIYYYSIIDLLLPLSIANQALLSCIHIFHSLTQLNPMFLGFLPYCIQEDGSILALQYLQYISPVVVWVIVILLVLCSRRCSEYVQFNDRTPITVISLLILLTFTAFTKTSFNIVIPITFTNISGTFVKVAPDTPYDGEIHIVFVIIAISVLLFGVIPFTLFLFTAPLLSRHCNMMRIKPLLDEFQACYKDEHRWMAGFYFICRLTYFSTKYLLSITIGVYIDQFLSLGILLFHIILQPYKKKWLNLMDTLMLADVLCVTLLYGNTAQTVFRDSYIPVRDVLSFFLVLFPLCKVVIMILIGFNNKFPGMMEKCRRSWTKKQRINLMSNRNLSVSYREPLLDMEHSSDFPVLKLNRTVEESSTLASLGEHQSTSQVSLLKLSLDDILVAEEDMPAEEDNATKQE